MTNSTKIATINNQEFTLKPTYAEMDDQVLMDLADQMLRELGGSRNMNSEIEFILKHAIDDYENAPFCYNDITNSNPTGEIEIKNGYKEMTGEEREQFVEELEEELLEQEENDADDEVLEEIQRLIDDANEADCESYPEIMQWFALDERIIYRLNELGECTLVNEYWGRQAFGQSITMDSCIKQVCYDIAMAWYGK